MATARELAEIELRLRDFVTAEMRRAGKTVKQEATRMEKAFRAVRRTVTGVGVALKVAFAAAIFKGLRDGVQRAMEFSHAMQEVRTIMDESSMSFDAASNAVSDLALSLGRSEIEVSKALYQTLSAGVTDTADAMMLLDQAGRLGVASLMSTNEAVDLLTNTFNAYGMEITEGALEATSDLMQQTIRLGKVIGPELAHSLGYVMPIAANLNVSLRELNAMLAALTLGGMNANMAATQLRQAFSQLLNPTDDAAALLREYNVDISAARVQSEGFLPVLKEIRDTFGGNAAAIQTLFPNIRGMIGVMALAGNQFDDVQRIMAEFDEAAGATDIAFGKMQNSLVTKVNKLKEAWTQAFSDIGASLLGFMDDMSAEEIDQRANAIRDIGESTADGWAILGRTVSATVASIGASLANLDRMLRPTEPFTLSIKKPDWPAFFDTSDAAKDALNDLIGLEQKEKALAIARLEQARITNDLTSEGIKYRDGLKEDISMMDRTIQSLVAQRDRIDQVHSSQAQLNKLQDQLRKNLATSVTPKNREGVIAEYHSLLQQISQTTKNFVAQGGFEIQLDIDYDVKKLVRLEERRIKEAQQGSRVGAIMFAGVTAGIQTMLAQERQEALGYLKDITEASVDADKERLDRQKFFLQLEDQFGAQGLAAKKARIDEEMQLDLDLFKNKRDAAWEEVQTSEEFSLLSVEQQNLRAQQFRALWDEDLRYYTQLLQKRVDEEKVALDKQTGELRHWSSQIPELLENAWDQASRDIMRSWKGTLRDLGRATAEDLGDVFAGGTGDIASLVAPTAAQELTSLIDSLGKASNQLRIFQSAASLGLVPQEAVDQLRQNIENVREFELAERIATEQTERLGFALRDVAGTTGVEFADALGESGSSLQVLAGMYIPTAEENLKNFNDQVAAAKQELARLETVDGISDTQLESMRLMIAEVENLRVGLEAAAGAGTSFGESMKIGFTDGLSNWADSVGTFEEQLSNLASGAMDELVNQTLAFVDGTKSSSEALAAFAESFFMELTKMILQLQIRNALLAMGFADGGIIGGGTGNLIPLATGGVVSGGLGRAMPVKGYAAGGPIVSEPHVALIGEGKMNEAVVPLPDGKSIPVQMSGGGGANISINIDAIDSASVKTMLIDEASTLTNIIRNAMDEDRLFHTTFSR